jgi:hypothetical protein
MASPNYTTQMYCGAEAERLFLEQGRISGAEGVILKSGRRPSDIAIAAEALFGQRRLWNSGPILEPRVYICSRPV